MIISLKIEILKVFSFEFNLSSNKELKLKKDSTNEKDSVPDDSAKQSTARR